MVSVGAYTDDADAVLALAKAARGTVGFLPDTSFHERAPDHRRVAASPLRAFLVVVVGVLAAGADRAERGEEQGVFESAVPSSRPGLGLEAGAGLFVTGATPA